MTKKQENDLRNGLNRYADAMTSQWYEAQHVAPEYKDRYMARYADMARLFELLGGDWKRDKNGKHKVFLCGLSGESE